MNKFLEELIDLLTDETVIEEFAEILEDTENDETEQD